MINKHKHIKIGKTAVGNDLEFILIAGSGFDRVVFKVRDSFGK